MSWGKTVVIAWNSELLEDTNHGLLESKSFGLVHFWWQVPSSYISGDSSSHGDFSEFWINVCQQVLTNWNVPVVLLLCVSLDLVILFDQWLKVKSVSVVIFRSGGIGSDTAVVVFKTTHHDVEKSLLVFLRK